jgi:hypothetical protein
LSARLDYPLSFIISAKHLEGANEAFSIDRVLIQDIGVEQTNLYLVNKQHDERTCRTSSIFM